MDLLASYGSDGGSSDTDDSLDCSGPAAVKKLKADESSVDKIEENIYGASSVSGGSLLAASSRLFGAPRHLDELGRVRAFPHVNGNWPSIIYVSLGASNRLRRCCSAFASRVVSVMDKMGGPADTVLSCFQGMGPPSAASASGKSSLVPTHISLSRPFALRAHHIQPLLTSITTALAKHKKFVVTLWDTFVFVNEERTGTFVGAAVTGGKEQFLSLISTVDKAIGSFHVESYYEDPVPHVSLCRVAGDQRAAIVKAATVCSACWRLPPLTPPCAECDKLVPPTEDTASMHCFPSPWLDTIPVLPSAVTAAGDERSCSDEDSDSDTDDTALPMFDIAEVCVKAGTQVHRIRLH